MRLAFVSLMASSPWGGSEQLWASAARCALEEGHEVFVSVFDWGGIPDELQELTKRGASFDWRRRNVFERGLLARSVGRIRRRFARNPFAAVEDFRPDRILVNQGAAFEAVSDPVAVSFVERAGKRVVLNCRVHADDEISDPERKATAARVFRAVDCAVFAAARNLADVERSLCCRLAGARVLHSPLSSSTQEPLLDWPDEAVPRLACVARLECRAKGQHALLQTLSAARWLSRPWQMVFYGRGPDADYLRQLAKFYAVEERVTFAGHVSDVREIWRNNHLLVLPSLYEGTPIALLEAMRCGRPVVATDVGDVSRFVTEGQTGFLAPVAEPRYLDEALERAWSRKAEWKAMGRQARENVCAKLDPDPAKTLLEWLTGPS